MTPQKVLEQFYRVMPRVSSRFGSTVPVISSFIDVDLLLNLEVADASSFQAGAYYCVDSLVMLNPFTSSNIEFGYWQITTTNDNLVTEPLRLNDERYVSMNAPPWDAQNPIGQVITRKKFTTRNNQAVGASGLLEESLNGEIGYMQCAAIDGNVVKLRFNEGYVYPCDCMIGNLSHSLRAIVVRDIGRAEQVYTSLGKSADNTVSILDNGLVAFIIMGATTVQPMRDSDAGIIAQVQKDGLLPLYMTTDFDIVVFWSRQSSQENAKQQIQQAHDEVFDAMCQVFFGALPDKDSTSNYVVVPKGHDMGLSNLANYVHVYSFQAVKNIDHRSDGIKPEHEFYDVPVRFVNMDLLMDAHIDIDPDPRLMGIEIELNAE